MRDLRDLERHQRAVDDGVARQMPLTSEEERGGVVGEAEGRETAEADVDPALERFATAGMEQLQRQIPLDHRVYDVLAGE